METIFSCCVPREDVLSASLGDYAAELQTVIRTEPRADAAATFFENTYPTVGLRRLIGVAARRLAGDPSADGSTIRLDSTFGGGKTHGMIALAHLARTPSAVPTAFLDGAARPNRPAAVAAYDGQMANVVRGIDLEPGLVAKTPWGDLVPTRGV